LIISLSVYGVKVLLSGKSKLFFIKYFIRNTGLGYRILTTAQFIDRSPNCAVTFNKPDFELVFFNFINIFGIVAFVTRLVMTIFKHHW